jgi:hypothetical protein
MICPGCGRFFAEAPERCPACEAKVRVCQPCFGTGQISVITNDVEDYSFARVLVKCNDCGGLGLVRETEPSVKQGPSTV